MSRHVKGKPCVGMALRDNMRVMFTETAVSLKTITRGLHSFFNLLV